jgi:hypothetical protein
MSKTTKVEAIQISGSENAKIHEEVKDFFEYDMTKATPLGKKMLREAKALIRKLSNNQMIIPAKASLAAIKRLNSGSGVRISLAEFRRQLIEIFPAYENQLLEKYADQDKLLETIGAPLNWFKEKQMIHDWLEKHQMIHDKKYPQKLKLLKKIGISFDEIACYYNCIDALSMDGLLRRKKPWQDTPLTKKGTRDLRYFRSFCVRYHDDYKKRIICLYSIKDDILRLANIGKHDSVYKYGDLDEEVGKEAI